MGIDSNLVAFLSTTVGASVFTIGLVSHRVHTSLTNAASGPSCAKAQAIVEDARGPYVLGGNVVLLAAVLAASVAELIHAAASWSDYATLVGLCLLEVIVVGLGYFDDRYVTTACRRMFVSASPRPYRARAPFRSLAEWEYDRRHPE